MIQHPQTDLLLNHKEVIKAKQKVHYAIVTKFIFYIIDETGKVQAKKMLRSLGVNLKESKFLDHILIFKNLLHS